MEELVKYHKIAPKFELKLRLVTGAIEEIQVRRFCKFILKWEFILLVLCAGLISGMIAFFWFDRDENPQSFLAFWMLSALIAGSFYVLMLTAISALFHRYSLHIFEPLLVVSASLFTWPMSGALANAVGGTSLSEFVFSVQFLFLATTYFEIVTLSFYVFLRRRLLEKYCNEEYVGADTRRHFCLAGSRFDCEEILFVKAENQYVRLHTMTGERLVSGQIVEIMRQVGVVNAIRTHRSFVVFSHAIAPADRQTYTDSTLLLKNGRRVPVSRRNLRSVKDKVGSLASFEGCCCSQNCRKQNRF